jgi:hypothetical protein
MLTMLSLKYSYQNYFLFGIKCKISAGKIYDTFPVSFVIYRYIDREKYLSIYKYIDIYSPAEKPDKWYNITSHSTGAASQHRDCDSSTDIAVPLQCSSAVKTNSTHQAMVPAVQ